jgi:hypothetical protein
MKPQMQKQKSTDLERIAEMVRLDGEIPSVSTIDPQIRTTKVAKLGPPKDIDAPQE